MDGTLEGGKRKEHSDIQIFLCGSQFPGGTIFLLAGEATQVNE